VGSAFGIASEQITDSIVEYEKYAPDYLPPSASALVKPELSTGDNQGSILEV